MGKPAYKTSELKVSSVSSEPSYIVGSFFNGVQIPEASTFDLYQHKSNNDRFVVHGENSTLEYNGETGVNESTNDYIVALYDPKKMSVELFKAPLIEGTVTSLENKIHKGPRVKSRGVRNIMQRNALGEAFGTKKAKAAIANLERNRIDSEKLEGLAMDIVEDVTEVTTDLPSRESLQDGSHTERPTPKACEDATSTEDIYPLDGIVPNNEWNAIRINSILEEEDPEKRLEIMPYSKSAFVSKNISKFVSVADTQKLKLVYYASLLLGVYNNRRVRDKATLMEKLGNKPAEILIDGILERFTVARRFSSFAKSKDRSFVIDPFHEDKLVCYLLALLFHIEGFTLELLPMAHELNMKPTRLQKIFNALGATIKPVGAGMAESLGLSKKEASTYKIAVLKVPFKLPEMTRRGRR